MLERIGARRVVLIAALGVAVLMGAFAATNLAPNTVYYLTPTELVARGEAAYGQTIRLGGLVKPGSKHGPDTNLSFVLTDGTARVR